MENRQAAPKKKLEKEVQSEILEWLKEKGFFYWRMNNKPTYDRARKTFYSLPKHTPSGLPDIVVVYKSRFIVFEVKGQGRLNNSQKTQIAQREIRKKFEENGAEYYIVKDLLDVATLFMDTPMGGLGK